MKYKVLIPCKNDKTRKSYDIGAIVTDADFDKSTLEHWVNSDPPVLRLVRSRKKVTKSEFDKEGGN